MIERTKTGSKEESGFCPFSVLVADPSLLIGKKISDILSREESVLWTFHVTKRDQLLSEAAKLHPDFVLADLRILKTPQTVDFLRQAAPYSRIISLIESKSAPYVRVTNNLGLDGMIEKGSIGRGGFGQILEVIGEGISKR